MTGFVFVSAKGAPGVTTVAAAVAGVASSGSESLLVELDPAGGSVQTLVPDPVGPGLVEAATSLRHDPRRLDAVSGNVSQVAPGLSVMVAPTMGPGAESVIRSVGGRWLPVLGAAAPAVMVDGGRWSPSQSTSRRLEGAALVVVVCQPTLAGVEHTRHLIQPLRETARQKVAVVVVGSEPYEPAEVAHHLGAPLAGVVAWDPGGAANLWSQGLSRRWLRSRLARSAADVLEGLVNLVPAREPAALGTGAAPPAPPGSPAAGPSQPAPGPDPSSPSSPSSGSASGVAGASGRASSPARGGVS